MRKTVLFALLFLGPSLTLPAQDTDLVSALNSLINSLETADDQRKLLCTDLLTTLTAIRETEDKQSDLRGSIQFSYDGNESRAKELHRASAGVSISRGTYPDEVSVNWNVGVQLENAVLKEEVSNLHISYDYAPSLNWEYYGFMNRLSDSYLGIDKRYELGGGLIWNWWTNSLTEDGTRARKKLRDHQEKPETKMLASDLLACLAHVPTAKDSVAVETIEKALVRAQRGNIKNHARFRFALLTGAFVELESASLSDSVWVGIPWAPGGDFNPGVQPAVYERVKEKVEHTATDQLVRLEVRPTFDFRPSDRWSLKLRTYFKVPLRFWKKEKGFCLVDEIGDPLDTVAKPCLDDRYDLRIHGTGNLTYKPSDNVDISLSYEVQYDHAPLQIYYADRFTVDGENLLFHAPKTHQIVRFKFGLNLK